MKKGIIVIDMHDNCKECPFVIKDMRLKTGLCAAWESLHDDMRIIPDSDKPDWCPVRELPEKRRETTIDEMCREGYSREDISREVLRSMVIEGWNTCLDKILDK